MTTIQSLLILALVGINPLLFFTSDRDNAKPLARIYPHSEIVITKEEGHQTVAVSEGDKLVFRIDDVNVGKIYFQVPDYRRFFRYTDRDMKNVDLVICKGNSVTVPEAGEINGFKIADGVWKVELSLHQNEDTYLLSHRLYLEDKLTHAQN